MKVKKLIGKYAIRTAPTKRHGDCSYTSDPVFILKVTKNHIICRTKYSESWILNFDFCDKNWTSYDSLIKGTNLEDKK